MERKLQEEGSHLRLYIYRQEDIRQEEIIGDISFSQVVRGGFQSCYLGYKVAQNHIRKGYCTEAIEAGIKFMFDDWNLHRIEANIMPRNEASKAVVRKLGFEEEGLAKKYLQIDDVWEDHVHFVKINANWQPTEGA